MRRTAVIGAITLATLILAAPVAANETLRWTDSHRTPRRLSIAAVG